MKEAAAANIAKVVGVSKLKTKYEAHEAKRRLCGEYDLFCSGPLGWCNVKQNAGFLALALLIFVLGPGRFALARR